MYKILLVEDDTQIREIITDYFSEKDNNIEVVTAKDGNEGLDKVYESEYDLVLLDIMMPGMDGFSLCREIRKNSIIPIIFLTARGREEDILYGYDMGCDDYIVKPFSVAELYVKVIALLKRAKGLVGATELECGSIRINPVTFVVKVNDEIIDLPPKQYALLKYLMENKGNVISRDQLLMRIWGYDYEGNDRVVDNHIKKLRQGLKSAGYQVKTVITKGYKIIE